MDYEITLENTEVNLKYAVDCPICKSPGRLFYICRHGAHLGAHCAECGELMKSDYWPKWINYIEDKPDEPATDKQIQYMRKLIYHDIGKLTLMEACDIIGMLEKSRKK